MRALWSLCLLALVGCAPSLLRAPQVTYDAPEALPIVQPDSDPRRWYVVVDTGIYGEQLFFLDTGFSHTTCHAEWIDELGLPARGMTRVRGEAGVVRAKRARLTGIRVAGHRIGHLTCLVRDLYATSSISRPEHGEVAGVLGADLLRRFHIQIDPSVPEVRLYPRDAAPSLDPEDPHVVPLRRERPFGRRFVVPVEIEGTPTPVLVDTGARSSHLDGERLELEVAREPAQVVIRGTGPSGETVQHIARYRVSSLILGGHELGPLEPWGRPAPPWRSGLLGLDVLGRLEQHYDFQGGYAGFRPVKAAPVPVWSPPSDAPAEAVKE